MSSLAIIATVKAPIEQLKFFINYHLNVGADQIILFFDDPNDKDIEQIQHYELVTVIPCTTEYWEKSTSQRPNSIEKRQVTNVNKGIQIALDKKCNWIAHIDSDELLNPKQDIKEVLKYCKADAIRFELLEAAPEREYYKNIYEPTLFKKKPTTLQIRMAKLLGCRRSIYNNEYLRGHLKSKMAIKLNSKIRKFGIHGPIDFDDSITIIDTKKIQLLHYDCVGIENWKLKWSRRLDGSATAEKMRGNRNEQFMAYTRAAKIGNTELSKVYQKIHTIPVYEKIVLFALGMLTRVTIKV